MYNSKKNFGDTEPSQIPIRKPNTNEYDKETGNKLTDYKMICELGRGSFGVVHRVLSLVNGNEYVLKKINIKHMKANRQKEALKEAQILKKVRHNNIIKYYTSFVEQDYLYIIMEYAESGDLATLIKSHKEKRKPFTEKQIWDFASELCQALEYLHKNNIIHRDIKPLNIFLSRDGHIKLGDLGVSKIVSSAAALQGTRVGTPLYLSPELVKQLPYDFKVDIWALGCVLYHLAALEAPFIGDNLISLGYNIVNKPPKPLSSVYSTQLTSLIMKFLDKSPTARPKLSDVWSYFPTKYRNVNDNNNQNTNANKVEYHSNSAAQLLKIDEEVLVQNKNYKPLTHWISPDKRNSQIDLPTRPFTANHLQGPHRDNLSPDKNNSKGSIRSQVYPIKANILSHNLNRNVPPSRYTPNPISSVDEPRNRSPSLEKESNNHHVKRESFQMNNAKLRRISQKEAKVEPEDSSIEKAIAHRQSPTIEVVKSDNNQKFNSHVPIQRSQTTDMHKIMMNPLINSNSSRMKINSKLGQAPSLQGFFSKPGSDSVPYMSRPQTAQQKPQRNVEEKAFNARDDEEIDDDDSSGSLETLGNLRTKAYNGMRIRPISANNLVTMQNQLGQSIENKVPGKGLKTALSISTIEKEPKGGETTITKIPESPKQDKQQYGGISPRNKSVSIERPKSAIGNIALNGQLQKEPATVGAENSPNSKYIKSGYGEWAFGRVKAQENSEKEKEKIAKFFQVSKLESNKPEVGITKEDSEEKQGYDSAKKIDYTDLLKRNLVNTSLRLDAVAKSMMKSSIDVSRKNESVMENGGGTRPTTSASSKKRLTIHDLM